MLCIVERARGVGEGSGRRLAICFLGQACGDLQSLQRDLRFYLFIGGRTDGPGRHLESRFVLKDRGRDWTRACDFKAGILP